MTDTTGTTDNDETLRDQDMRELEASWRGILGAVGYKHDGTYNLANQPEVANKLGRTLMDYMTASIYDMAWEGFTDGQVGAIKELFKDMLIAVKEGL